MNIKKHSLTLAISILFIPLYQSNYVTNQQIHLKDVQRSTVKSYTKLSTHIDDVIPDIINTDTLYLKPVEEQLPSSKEVNLPLLPHRFGGPHLPQEILKDVAIKHPEEATSSQSKHILRMTDSFLAEDKPSQLVYEFQNASVEKDALTRGSEGRKDTSNKDSIGEIYSSIIKNREEELIGIFTGQMSMPGMPNKLENMHFYLPTPVDSKPSWNISQKCLDDVHQIKSILWHPKKLQENIWILKLIDSWGRYEGGFLQGNIYALGFIEECLSVHINKSQTNTGRYCLVSYSFESQSKLNSYPSPFFSVDYKDMIPLSHYGTCIPSSCSTKDFQENLDFFMDNVGRKVNSVSCQSLADEAKYDSSNIFGIIVFSAFGCILTSASLLDIYFKKTDRLQNRTEGKLKYLLAFSVPENMSKIFQIRYSKSSDVISCIHGIRFLSMTWVILGHQYAFMITNSTNLPLQKTQQFFFQIIMNGDKSVDTFFVLSGIVMAYQFFKNSNSIKDSFPWVQYYLHRILRLAPPIALMGLFIASISGLLARGPFGPTYKDIYVDSCRTFWWVDWTFLSNILFRYGDELAEKTGESPMCMGQCWYTAVDTQLYIVMPIIILPMLRWEKKGILNLVFWTLMSFVIRGLIIGLNNPVLKPVMFGDDWEDGFNKLYTMPFARASPYLIGFGTGFLLAKLRGQNVRLTKVQVCVGWLLATAVGLYVMFALYPYNQVGILNKPEEMSDGYAIFYHTFQRGLWGLSISWVIFACHTGYGGVVNKFLSYPPIQPLSRLTYCFYLVAMPLQTLIFYSKLRTTYTTHLSQVMDTCGILLISGVGALLLSLTIESPVINIMKLKMTPNKPSKLEQKCEAHAEDK